MDNAAFKNNFTFKDRWLGGSGPQATATNFCFTYWKTVVNWTQRSYFLKFYFRRQVKEKQAEIIK